MWCCGSVCLVMVTCVLVTTTAAAVGHTRLLGSSLAFFTNNTRNSHRNNSRRHSQNTKDTSSRGDNNTQGNNSSYGSRHIHRSFEAVVRRLQDESDLPEAVQERVLRRILRSTGGRGLSGAINNTEESKHTYESKGVGDMDKWRCLLQWMKIHSHEKLSKDQRTCEKDGEKDVDNEIQEKILDECVPLLFLVIPSMCNGTQSCVNVTEASIQSLIHRYFVWERKKKRRNEDEDAVIYIVVVLAFYSFGIVFMMANFVRQEQRELEETKMYKQYVKLARDRWLTTRGNLANKLALQALNTFNAVPQTTDVNKVTFV